MLNVATGIPALDRLFDHLVLQLAHLAFGIVCKPERADDPLCFLGEDRGQHLAEVSLQVRHTETVLEVQYLVEDELEGRRRQDCAV